MALVCQLHRLERIIGMSRNIIIINRKIVLLSQIIKIDKISLSF